MIELILEDRCTDCGLCVAVCPMDVFEPGAGRPRIARQADCQTCFLCELYCREDALFVAPDVNRSVGPLEPEAVVAAGLVGRYRRDSGWDEWASVNQNEHWRMGEIFARGRAIPRPPADPAQS